MLQSISGILIFIIGSVTKLFVGILLLRFWMQVVRVRPPNSLAQFVFQLSDWLVRPLRRLLPGVGGFDWASLTGACMVLLAEQTIVLCIHIALPALGFYNWQIMLLIAGKTLIECILYGWLSLIVLEVIFSWVNPNAPLAPFVRALNEPLLRPLRRIVPTIGSVDITTVIALLILQVALMLLGEIVPSVL